jgi:hypothetical protein
LESLANFIELLVISDTEWKVLKMVAATLI